MPTVSLKMQNLSRATTKCNQMKLVQDNSTCESLGISAIQRSCRSAFDSFGLFDWLHLNPVPTKAGLCPEDQDEADDDEHQGPDDDEDVVHDRVDVLQEGARSFSRLSFGRLLVRRK